jgi:hypothetical protein
VAHLAMESLLHLQASGRSEIVSGFYAMCGAFDLEGSESRKHSRSDSLLISGPSALANPRRLTPSLPANLRRSPVHSPLDRLPPALFIAGKLDPIAEDSVRMSRAWRRPARQPHVSLRPRHRMASTVCRHGLPPRPTPTPGGGLATRLRLQADSGPAYGYHATSSSARKSGHFIHWSARTEVQSSAARGHHRA